MFFLDGLLKRLPKRIPKITRATRKFIGQAVTTAYLNSTIINDDNASTTTVPRHVDVEEEEEVVGGCDVGSETICFLVSNRRYFDLSAALIGLLFNAVHLAILIYLKIARKGKSYELLFSQGVLALLTHVLLLIGCINDITHFCKHSYVLTWLRAYVYLFVVNSLFAAYGFLIVALCIDRYVALNNPLYYRHTFVRKRTRWSLIVGSCILGLFTCARWIPFNTISSKNNQYELIENQAVSRTWYYTVWRMSVYVEQYLFAGIAMLVVSFSNIRKLKEIKKGYKEEKLGMQGQIKAQWVRNHTTIANICVILATAYVTFNWPYCIVDYMYTDERLTKEVWYGMVVLIINFLQVLYMQLNLFCFAYCSQMYRRTLLFIVRYPCRKVVDGVKHFQNRSNGLKKIDDARISTNTTNTIFSVC